jgi:hypothetical protein
VNNQMNSVFLSVLLVVGIFGAFALRIFQGLRSSPQDLARIRREFKQDGETVLAITRMGTEWFARSGPWRKYEVQSRNAAGVLERRTIGLEPGWISDALIWAYDPSTQRPLAWRRSTFCEHPEPLKATQAAG